MLCIFKPYLPYQVCLNVFLPFVVHKFYPFLSLMLSFLPNLRWVLSFVTLYRQIASIFLKTFFFYVSCSSSLTEDLAASMVSIVPFIRLISLSIHSLCLPFLQMFQLQFLEFTLQFLCLISTIRSQISK